MFANAFAPHLSLRESCRIPAISRDTRISLAEVACLLACGALAAFAIGFLHISLRVPGHAILRGALPMALGLALVPRRSAGIVMSTGAVLTATAMSAAQVGTFPSTALVSVLVFGLVLDIALIGRASGWRLYARFGLAGAVANLIALAFKLAGFQLGIESLGGSGQFMRFAMPMIVSSYILCGALAGLLGATVGFRARGNDDLRRD